MFFEATNFVAENSLIGLGTSAKHSANSILWNNGTVAKMMNRNMADNARLESPFPRRPIIDIPPNATAPRAIGKRIRGTGSNTDIPLHRSPPPVSPSRLKQPPNSYPHSSNTPSSNCSAEQKEILSALSTGQNVFFTGSAGTGKTFVVQKIRQLLKSQGFNEHSDFFVTASTGILQST